MDLKVKAMDEKGVVQSNPEVTLDKLGLTKNESFRYYSVSCVEFRLLYLGKLNKLRVN
jgi:hypothetical protein